MARALSHLQLNPVYAIGYNVHKLGGRAFCPILNDA